MLQNTRSGIHSLLILLFLSLLIDGHLLRSVRSPKGKVQRSDEGKPKTANVSVAENARAKNSTAVAEHQGSGHKKKGGHHGHRDSRNRHHNKANNTTTTAKPDVDLVPVECGKEYAVQPGEACSAISSEFGLTRDEFLSLNPGIECKGGLNGGMRVCIRKKKKMGSSEETDDLNALINGEQVNEDVVKGGFDISLHGK